MNKQEIISTLMGQGLSKAGAEAALNLLKKTWQCDDAEFEKRLNGLSLEKILAAIWERTRPAVVDENKQGP